MKLLRAFVMTAAVLLALPAFAHKASDAYLQLRSDADGLRLRVDVALRDLDAAIELDADGDGKIRWSEVRSAWPAIESYVMSGVQIDGCVLRPLGRALERRSDGAYAALSLGSDCRLAANPVLRYHLMRDVDATHRGLMRLERAGVPSRLVVLDPGAELAQAPGPAAASTPTFVAEGMRHILGGYDHVLFLLCLLLPAVMRRAPVPRGTPTRWQPVAGLKQALMPVLGIVSTFTVAHSITLGLAATQRVSLSPSLIEPAIALTIVLAAVDNLRPIFGTRRGAVTFLFGLIHGFGFAGVLGELDLAPSQFAWALLQFNLGLELGQLLVVLLALGGLFALRESPRYPVLAIRGGSMAAIVVGALWFIERTADLSLWSL